MATKKSANTDKVSIRIPKERGNTDDAVVIVNGRATQIPKGKWCDVSPAVAEVLNNASAQKDASIDLMSDLQNEYNDNKSSL